MANKRILVTPNEIRDYFERFQWEKEQNPHGYRVRPKANPHNVPNENRAKAFELQPIKKFRGKLHPHNVPNQNRPNATELKTRSRSGSRSRSKSRSKVPPRTSGGTRKRSV